MPQRFVCLPAVALLCFAAAAPGCGGDSGGSSGGGPPSGGPLATAEPKEVLSASARAMARVPGYHIEGTQTDREGTTRVTGDVTAAGGARLRFAGDRMDLAMIVAGTELYMKAPGAFWRARTPGATGDKLASLLGDKWVRAPGTADDQLRSVIDDLLPRTLAHCLPKEEGTIENLGARTVDGRRVVVLRSKGDAPGGAPGELTVSATGEPLPLRVRQTGRTKPGGVRDPRCDDKDDSTTRSDIRLSGFDRVAPIRPPKHVVDIDRLQQDGSGATVQS
jgi:hypothetical protein